MIRKLIRVLTVLVVAAAWPGGLVLASAELYQQHCAACHGDEGEGGHGGGGSLARMTDIDVVVLRVGNGLNLMPAFATTLTPEEILDVSTYVVEELPH